MAGSPTDEAATHAGRYRRIHRLGAGGMATVFLAEDEVLGREVAIKRVHSASPEDTLKRFRREAKLGASVNHPNLVAVYDSISEDDSLLIVMEYVEGESLSERLRRERMSEDDALDVLEQVASAVDHLHEHSVVHRDIKPSNILLRKDGLVKVADLGIATATDMTAITGSSAVIGSLPYMAPERLHGAAVDSACDVFSLGAVAFEMLAGHRVHDSATPEEQIRLASSDFAPDLIDAWPAAPAATARVLAQAMSPDAGARPFSAAAFVKDLRASLDASGGGDIPTTPIAVETGEPEDPTTTLEEQRPVVAPPLPLPPPQAPGRPPSPPSPLPRPPGAPGSRRGALAALALAVVAIAAVAVAALGGGDEGAPAQPATKQNAKQKPGGETTTQPAAGTTTSEAPPKPPEPATDASSLNDRGKALIDSGDPASAIPLLERAVNSYEPGTEDLTYYYALFNLGNALRLAGRPAEAIPYLEERLQYPNQTAAVQAELDLARQEAGLPGEPSDSGDGSGGITPGPEGGGKPGKGPKPDKGPKPGKGPEVSEGGVGPE